FQTRKIATAAKGQSSRPSAIKLPPTSTTATTPPDPFFAASACAAAIARRAPSKDSDRFSTVCAPAAPAIRTTKATSIVLQRRFIVPLLWLPTISGDVSPRRSLLQPCAVAATNAD